MRTIAAALAALLAAGSARAAEHDAQFWNGVFLTAPLGKGWDAGFEVQTRVEADFSGEGQVLVRPSLTKNLPGRVQLTAGYLYFRSQPEVGPITHEHRPWQQLTFPILGKPGALRLDSRTRLEQRFREDGRGDVGWRVRQQLRLEAPLGGPRKAGALVWNETFLGLNDTRWGARDGVDQVRWFGGFAIPLSEGVRIEPGYLNQWILRDGRDLVNHAFTAYVFIRF